jgi:membrane protein involved in colicin uptake
MENKTVNLELKTNVEESIAGLKALKRQLRDTAAGSEEFKKLYNQIDDLEDKIKSSRASSADWIDSLESAGGPLGMLGASLNRAKVATQSFGGALKATGIGLIVSLLGGLVAAFSENEGAMKKLQPLTDGLKKAFQGVFRAVEPLFNTFVDLATDALPYVTQGIGTVYSAMMAYFTFIKESGGGVMKILKGVFTLDGDAISAGIDQVGGSFKKTQQSYGDSMKRFSEGSKELTEKEKEQEEKREENRKKAQEKREAAEQKAKEKADKLEAEKAEKKKKYDEDVLKGQEELKQATEKAKEKAAQDEAKIQEDAQKIIDDLAKSKETPAQKLQREFEEKKAVLEAANKSTFELEMQHLSDLENMDAVSKEKAKKSAEDNAAALIKIEELKTQAKIEQAQRGAALLSNISDLIGKDTAAGKVAAVAATTINTYAAAQAAFLNAQKNPISIIGPAYPYISAGLAIAGGLKNVQAILSVPTPSGGGGGGAPSGGGGMAASTAPSFNVVGQGGANQIAQSIAGQEQQPLKAYVVSNDVTTSQSLDRNIVNNASIG